MEEKTNTLDTDETNNGRLAPVPTPEERRQSVKSLSQLSKGNILGLMLGLPLLPESPKSEDSR